MGILALSFAACREMAEQEARDKQMEAQAALEAEDWEEANELFLEVTTLNPENPDAWTGRGLALTELGEPEAAREHYEEALDLLQERLENNPDDRAAFHKKTMVLVLLNKSETARELAAEAIERNPGDSFFERMPELIDQMEVQFEDEILDESPEDQPE